MKSLFLIWLSLIVLYLNCTGQTLSANDELILSLKNCTIRDIQDTGCYRLSRDRQLVKTKKTVTFNIPDAIYFDNKLAINAGLIDTTVDFIDELCNKITGITPKCLIYRSLTLRNQIPQTRLYIFTTPSFILTPTGISVSKDENTIILKYLKIYSISVNEIDENKRLVQSSYSINQRTGKYNLLKVTYKKGHFYNFELKLNTNNSNPNLGTHSFLSISYQ